MAPPPFTIVPPELLPLVFRHLRPQDLFSVALTCRAFSDAAKSLLWEKAELIIFPSPVKRKSKNRYYALEYALRRDAQKRLEIMSKGSWGGLVKSLVIKIDGYNKEDFEPEGKHLHSFEMVKTIVQDVAKPPSALHTLSVSDEFLSFIKPFSSNLRRLRLELVDRHIIVPCLVNYSPNMKIIDRGVPGIIPLPTLPVLKELWISWKRVDVFDDMSSGFYPFLLMILCQHLCSVPRLEYFSLDLEATDLRGDAIRPVDCIASRWVDEIDEVINSLVIPTLKRAEFRIPQSFLFPKVYLDRGRKMKNEGLQQMRVHRLLRNFIGRHCNTIERFLWSRVDEKFKSPDETTPWRILPDPVPTELMDLALDSAVLKEVGDYLLLVQQTHAEKMKALRLLSIGAIEKDWVNWFRTHVQPFTSLTRLKLVDWWLQYDISAAITKGRLSAEDENVLGGYSMMELISILPRNLEHLTVSLRKLCAAKLDALDEFKLEAPLWFQSLRRLHTLKLKLFSMGEDENSTITQTLRFHRLPKDAESLTNKKLCIWNLLPIHAPGGHDSHDILYNYREMPLEGFFQGKDGKPWNWVDQLSETQVREIKLCGMNGKAGDCKHWLMAKNIWVALP
ncbi:hypothetical protein ABW20_dc0103977 [Dactylellina cionopaga]|nr:hypothetical protein ABW20_dc0103977 [Dactylellina cionopaga]